MGQPSIGLVRATGLTLVALAVAVGVALVGISTVTTDVPFGQLLVEIAQDTGYTVGMAAAIAAGAMIAIAGGLLYSVLRWWDPALAMVGAIGFALAGLVLAGVGTAGLALGDSAAAMLLVTSPQEAAALATSAVPLAQLIDKGWYVGATTFLPMGLGAFGLVVARSGMMPRALGAVAIAIAALLPFAWANDSVATAGAGATIAWLVAIGSWVIVQGVRQSPMVTVAAPDFEQALTAN